MIDTILLGLLVFLYFFKNEFEVKIGRKVLRKPIYTIKIKLI